MKVATWNVNSIRARLNNFLDWLKEEQPDIVLIQELKCITEAFPFEEIEDLGYNVAVAGQKTYNGVGVISKFPLTDINSDLLDNPIPEEARFIEAIINFSGKVIRIASVYVPNGQAIDSPKYENKLKFFEALIKYYKNIRDEQIIIGGDFNVAMQDKDIYDPEEFKEQVLFSLRERQAMRKLISCGFIDCYRVFKQDPGYSWWDYRGNSFRQNHGARIDYLLSNIDASIYIKDCFVSKDTREKDKASDHAPVSLIYSL